LIADDNLDVVETFEIMLQTLGHEVHTATDGIQVLERAEQFKPEVIMLDIGMPKLDGFETARRLRQQAWARDTLLIAVTGWGHETDKRMSAEAGFNAHLVKPIEMPAILKLLDKVDEFKARSAG